jgi:molybdenum cofactor biosynthesis enzyme MoaA
MERVILLTDYYQRKNNSQIIFDKKVKSLKKCSRPWETLIINQYGESYICLSPAWLPKSIGSILDTNDIYELLNSYEALSIRTEILNNRYSYCNSNICGVFFSELNKTDFESVPNTTDFELLNSSNFENSAKVIKIPSDIIFDFDYTCNFVCPSCRVDLINNNKGPIADINSLIVEKIKKLIIDNIKFPTEIRWAGGEPFISKAYAELWEYIIESKNTSIKNVIQTNGSYLKKKEELLLNFLPYISKLHISFDAGTADTYVKNRVNGNWQTLLENSEWVINLIKKNNFKTRVTADFVTQLNNYMEIPDYVSIAKKIGFDTIKIAKMWNWNTWPHEEFQKRNVSDKSHPHYKNFLDILKHPDILNDNTILKNYWTNDLNDKI